MYIKDPRFLIFRDDDIGDRASYTEPFIRAHEKFNKYGVSHEIAVITRHIFKQKELLNYIQKQDNINIQFHAHNHGAFDEMDERALHQDFSTGIKMLKDLFGVTPTIWYPPFNRANKTAVQIAKDYGLTTSTEAHYLESYIRLPNYYFNPRNPYILNIHFWSDEQCQYLEDALQIYSTQISNAIGRVADLYHLRNVPNEPVAPESGSVIEDIQPI